MKKIKFVFLVITCEKNINKFEKLKKQKWFKEFVKSKNVELLIAIGDKNKASKKGDYLFLKTPEKMTNLSKKLFESFKFIKKNYDFEYLIKCDDDIKVKNFSKILELFQKRDYSGIIRKTTKKRALLWATKNNLKIKLKKHIEVDYAVGTMFCLSKKAFYPLLKELPKIVKYNTKHLAGNNDTLIGRAFASVEKKEELTKSTTQEINFFKKNIKEHFDLRKLKPTYLALRIQPFF
ncbi:MAG: hypothetical protein WC821_00610 [archaeon]|jgi:hypothetical protein